MAYVPGTNWLADMCLQLEVERAMERLAPRWEEPVNYGGSGNMDSDQPRRRLTRVEAARCGGLAVSVNRAHMAQIGRKGGQTVSQNREHMARIGEKGGNARAQSRRHYY